MSEETKAHLRRLGYILVFLACIGSAVYSYYPEIIELIFKRN